MSDNETIILINDSDVAEGFFRWSTSKPKQFTKLCKRIGGEDKLLEVKLTNHGSKITSWACKVPVEYLSKRNWSIGPKRKASARSFMPVRKHVLELNNE
jgi:hypothetical protein